MSAPMKSMHKIPLLRIVRLALIGLCLVGQTALAQPKKEDDISLERQAATDLLTKIREGIKTTSGKGTELGEHPFHFVFLVDSSRAASRSPETLFARNVIGQFLKMVAANEDSRNVTLENRSLASLYPYQLDLYKTSPWVVQALDVVPETIAKITDAVPQTYLTARPNGMPYVNDAAKRRYDGHDNVQPRRDLLDMVGTEIRGRPTVLIQITTNPLNEAPTDPKLDARIRAEQGRTGKLEDSGFKPYSATQTASRHSPDAVQVHFWTYGPDENVWRTLPANLITHPARGPKPTEPKPKPAVKPKAEPKKGSIMAWLIPLIAILVIGGVAAWWLTAKVAVVVEGIPATVRRGQELGIVATGSESGGRVVLLPPAKAAGAPTGTLAVMKMVGSQVQIEGRTCTVSVSGGSTKASIPLKPGPAGNQISLSVKGGFTTTIQIKVLA